MIGRFPIAPRDYSSITRTERFADLRGAVWASVWVALANSVLGAGISTFLYGGMTGVPLDYIAMGIVTAGRSILQGAFLARVPSNLIDKGIAVFVAYFFYRRLLRPEATRAPHGG